MSFDVTYAMAQFAIGRHTFDSLARERARDALIDCMGCMLAGSREALAGPLLATLPAFDAFHAQTPSLLVGTSRYASPSDAALYNGTIAHALDFDDTNHPAYAHPSAVLVSTMLALAPLVDINGRDVIDAYIVGFECFGKLGRALNKQHYKRGWHTTGTFGALAAVASAGRLLGLSEAQMVMAFGIAASSASGLRANFGSMTKPLHAGQAARNGVLAALLARSGFTASEHSLEHERGFLAVFNDGIGFDAKPLCEMGIVPEILTEHGLALKPYAACGATHPGIEAAEQLHRILEGRAIRSVRVGVCDMAFSPLIHVMPDSALEAKFSLHFCVAVALLYGDVRLSTFSDANVNDPRIRALIPNVTMELDDRWKDDNEFATEVSVETEDGARLTRFVPLAQGKPARWFSPERLRGKFNDCASRAASQDALDPLWDVLRQIDSEQRFSAVVHALKNLPLHA
ncbi:MmgE/PrpD family protein [Paraburkholderia aspalathi]|uniref:2-methylcitrate dehydratase PrpD n=1 Tax=Paraburkholderia aspalathi TaxID=1324617 RepID=A0A1I7DC65_9BURK|nr:MmgE/PrpD family protein [Paraburkholderia aspalathi]SFU09257.1 2-methylcitrate dehydratase PrpD [Paraburkholderia aspalathi]